MLLWSALRVQLPLVVSKDGRMSHQRDLGLLGGATLLHLELVPVYLSPVQTNDNATKHVANVEDSTQNPPP